MRILPIAVTLVVSAMLSPIVVRYIGLKFTVAAGLAAIAGGLWQISAESTVATTYGDVVPGLLLLGLGAGLLLPTATNSVVGSVPQGDSGIGSATNAVALQVGGALGVAVIGSLMSTRYQHRMTAALAGRHLPIAATHTILGSLGGALAVADQVGGTTGAMLSHAARSSFMNGLAIRLRGWRHRCFRWGPRRARLVAIAPFPTVSRSRRQRREELNDPARDGQHFFSAVLNRTSAELPLDESPGGETIERGVPLPLLHPHPRRRPVARANRRDTISRPLPPRRACGNLMPPRNHGVIASVDLGRAKGLYWHSTQAT